MNYRMCKQLKYTIDMIRFWTLLLLFATPSLVSGQDLKPINKKGQGFTEEYFVLAKNTRVKQGEYKRFDKAGRMVMQGTYESNKRIGLWEFYENEELIQEYDFTDRAFNHFKNSNYNSLVLINDQVKEMKLDSEPQYFGLLNELNTEFNKVSRYPEKAKQMGVEGKVVVSAWIDENDEVTDIQIVRGIMN
jgi:hypothetical protein